MSSRIYGPNAVFELLTAAPQAVTAVLIAKGAAAEGDEALIARAEALAIPVKRVDSEVLKRRSEGRGGVRVAAEIRHAAVPDLREITAGAGRAPLVLALDGVTDPHNLGAIVRSAAAFGADAVIVGRDRSAPLNDAAVRASAGAVAYVPVIRVTNLPRALRQLADQGLWPTATVMAAPQSLWEADLTLPLALVLGAEGPGVRPGVIKACELTVSLPLPGAVGSLNVSVFAGVALAEASRQRAAQAVGR